MLFTEIFTKGDYIYSVDQATREEVIPAIEAVVNDGVYTFVTTEDDKIYLCLREAFTTVPEGFTFLGQCTKDSDLSI